MAAPRREALHLGRSTLGVSWDGSWRQGDEGLRLVDHLLGVQCVSRCLPLLASRRLPSRNCSGIYDG